MYPYRNYQGDYRINLKIECLVRAKAKHIAHYWLLTPLDFHYCKNRR